jgi:hypothetical protein
MATATTMLGAVVKPDPTESDALSELKQQIDAAFSAGYTPCLIDRDGNSIELPDSVFEALTFVVRGMASGHTMTLMPSGKLLTTRPAPDMLQVSRPHRGCRATRNRGPTILTSFSDTCSISTSSAYST